MEYCFEIICDLLIETKNDDDIFIISDEIYNLGGSDTTVCVKNGLAHIIYTRHGPERQSIIDSALSELTKCKLIKPHAIYYEI